AEDVIETVRGRGYLFNTEVRWIADEVAGSPPAEPAVPSAAASPPEGAAVAPTGSSGPLPRALLVAGALSLPGIGVLTGIYRSRHLSRSDPGPPIRALAVLPLENLSHDPEQEYFADAMTDDLITELSKISALRVISRTSVMSFK